MIASLQDSSKYSSWSQGARFFLWSPVTHFFFRHLGSHSKGINYKWNHCHSDVPQFFQLSGNIQVFVYLFAFFYFHCGLLECQNPQDDKFFSCYIILNLVLWLGLGDPFLSQDPIEFCVSYFLGQILVCAYTICQHGEILIYCTIFSGLTFPRSHAYFCISFVLHLLMW